MPSYEEAKAKRFTVATTKTFTGVPLDTHENHPLVSSGSRPIQLCQCVTEPCDCSDEPIAWVKKADVHEQVAIDRYNRAGDQLQQFQIDLEATVVLELDIPIKARDLGRRRYFSSSANLPFRPPNPLERIFVGDRSESSSYVGEACAGGVLYDVWQEGSTSYYVAKGSC